jgi:serine/threonine-protein kinase
MALARRDLSGTVIDGRYRVEYPLGSGGMGSVWSVQHIESLKRYALKTLAVELAVQPAARERLLREARAGASLRSRHVVQVVDVQVGYVHDGEPLPYLVMERLEGLTLEQWLTTRGPLAPGQVLWTVRQVGRALHLAHERGIVHRDVKPSNIFLTVDEEGAPVTKLCDFGIAKLTPTARAQLLNSTGAHTSTGDFLGTPLYLAPELLRGAAQATAAADQWALGLTAFRALTGREYFHDATSGPELVLRIAQDPLPLPSRLAAFVPPAFDAWFLRSCERQPERRFASVAEQVDALAEALAPATPEAIDLSSRGSAERAESAGREVAARERLAALPATLGEEPAPSGARRTVGRRVALAACVAWGVAATAWVLRLDPRGTGPAPESESVPETAPVALAERTTEEPAAAPVEAELPPAMLAPTATTRPAASAAEGSAPATPHGAAPRPASSRPVTATTSPPSAPPRSAPTAAQPRTGTPPSAPDSAATPGGLGPGATCGRSSECASRLCLAERCR